MQQFDAQMQYRTEHGLPKNDKNKKKKKEKIELDIICKTEPNQNEKTLDRLQRKLTVTVPKVKFY